MPLATVIAGFKAEVVQCDGLIANAHRTDAAGRSILPLLDQKQISVAAFLNLFVAWETFLESSISEFMIGSPTISGSLPVRYISPVNIEAARSLVIGVQRYFDYGNHEFVRKLVKMYFKDGYPYEPYLSAVYSDLQDLRTMRNASAHISSTTQTALEGLASRIFSRPKPNIELYTLLMSADPRSSLRETVYSVYKNKLVTTAELILQG